MKLVKGKEAEYAEYVAKNKDPYGAAVVRYAAAWADAMEKEIAAGKKLEDVAETTSHATDTEGITGFMYSCAVSGLAHLWAHGDALRRWHNGQYGVSEEKAKGGTVNPAVFSVG
jgi:hypothetical protein